MASGWAALLSASLESRQQEFWRTSAHVLMHGLGVSHWVRSEGLGKCLYAKRDIVGLLSLFGGSGVPERGLRQNCGARGFLREDVKKGRV